MMLLSPEIPSITFCERNIDPVDSHIDPKRNAIPRVTVFAPTGVPHEFAESFAPTAKDKINPNTIAASRVYNPNPKKKSKSVILIIRNYSS